MVKVVFDDEDPFGIHVGRGRIINSPKQGRLKYKTPAAYKKRRKSSGSSQSVKGSRNARSGNIPVVKITGGATSKTAMYQHFRYISRRGTLTLHDDEGNLTSMQEAKVEADAMFDLDEARKGAKKTYQMVFSISSDGQEEPLRKAVHETMKELYPEHRFFTVIHNDTKHTHAHVVLMRRTKDLAKRVEIKKADLNKIKKKYSQKLNQFGIPTQEHLSETEKQKRRPDGSKSKVDKRKGSNIYTVVDYGEAPYQFHGDPSYYLLLKNKNGVIKQHWSKGLRNEILAKGIKPGDHITLKKMNKTVADPHNPESRYVRSIWEMEKRELPQERFDFSKPIKIIDYGHAPYKFDADGKDSFYIVIQQGDQPADQLWAKELEVYIRNKGIKPGDELVHGTGKQQSKAQTAIHAQTKGMKL